MREGVTHLESSRTAILFVRVSSDEQVEGMSLESQEKRTRDWCQQRGYEVAEVIRAEGESAYMDDMKSPDVVVVYSMDRWARSLVVSSASIRTSSSQKSQ